MNKTLLFQHFDRIAEAPDAIPRLCRFILDLAVRGKLVPTEAELAKAPHASPGRLSPSTPSVKKVTHASSVHGAQGSTQDACATLAPEQEILPYEPASELLKRIEAEKARLVNEGKIRKPKPLPPVDPEEVPFEIPEGWEWVRLASLGSFSGGMTPAKNVDFYWSGKINWFSPKDFRSPRLYDSELKISDRALKDTRLNLYPPGCLLIVARSGILRRTVPVSINEVPCTVNQDVKVLSPFIGGMERYLQTMFQGLIPWILAMFVKTGTTVESLKYTEFELAAFPLPPLAEQHRIVAKVDELMAICDDLERAEQNREARKDRFVAATHHRLNNPEAADGAPATNGDWRAHARFFLRKDTFERLTTRPQDIKQLRQTILNLAVRGKLVPQDPKDEPASELLKRIEAEKARLVKEGKIRKPKPLPPIEPDEVPFEVPEGWEWVRLGYLACLITKGSSPRWQGIEYVDKESGILFVTSENVGNYRLRKMDAPKYVEARFNEIEPRSRLGKGDILMNLVGASIGRTAIYDIADEANINQAVALIRLIEIVEGVKHDYLLHYLNSPTAIAFMLGSQVETAQPNISLTNVNDFPVPLPPHNEQARIVGEMHTFLDLCNDVEETATSVDARRNSLLNAAFSL